MNPTLKMLTSILLTWGIALAAPAFSASMGFSLPPESKQGNVSYVSGGIGQDEASTFQHDAKHYPLEFEFLMINKPRDAFLADVSVEIRNRNGKTVLHTVSKGPFLLAKLPPGKYKITADIKGIVKHATVNVGEGKHEKAVLVWPKSARLDS